MTFQERIERDLARQNEAAVNDNDPEELGFDSDYFGIDNIKSFPACLDLRLPDGSRVALPYGFIQQVQFSPAEGISIATDKNQIKVIGRDLERLFDYLTAFRVRYIRANAGYDGHETGLFVGIISIEDQ